MAFYVANAIEAERGVVSFGAICPGTGKIIGIEDDGKEARPVTGLLARCPYCHTHHELAASALFRLPVSETRKG